METRELPLHPDVEAVLPEIKKAVRVIEVVFLDGEIRCFADYRSFHFDSEKIYFQWDRTGEFANRHEDLCIPMSCVRWWGHLNVEDK